MVQACRGTWTSAWCTATRRCDAVWLKPGQGSAPIAWGLRRPGVVGERVVYVDTGVCARGGVRQWSLVIVRFDGRRCPDPNLQPLLQPCRARRCCCSAAAVSCRRETSSARATTRQWRGHGGIVWASGACCPRQPSKRVPVTCYPRFTHRIDCTFRRHSEPPLNAVA